jgi:hypothetical protein
MEHISNSAVDFKYHNIKTGNFTRFLLYSTGMLAGGGVQLEGPFK